MNLRQQSMVKKIEGNLRYFSRMEVQKIAKAISTLSKSNDHCVESHRALEEAIEKIDAEMIAMADLYRVR